MSECTCVLCEERSWEADQRAMNCVNCNNSTGALVDGLCVYCEEREKVAKLEAEVARLQMYRKSYGGRENDIAKLEAKVSELTAENERLRVENAALARWSAAKEDEAGSARAGLLAAEPCEHMLAFQMGGEAPSVNCCGEPDENKDALK